MARIPRLAPGTHVHDEVSGRVYGLDKYLGQGGFGAVYLANIVTPRGANGGKPVCLKYSERVEQWHGEVYFNGLLRHQPHVVKMHSAFPATVILRRGRRTAFFISTEYIAAGTVHDHLLDGAEPLQWTERQVVFRTRQLLKPLRLLHTMGVSHRDITPPNVFLGSRQRLLLGDFGITRAQLLSSGSRVDAYNPAFSPRRLGTWWNPADDVYQVGLLMASLLAGEELYNDVTRWDINQLTRPGPLRDTIKAAISARSKRPRDATALCERLDAAYDSLRNVR